MSDFLYGVKEVTVSSVIDDDGPEHFEVKGVDASGNGYVLTMSRRVAHDLKEQLQEVFKVTAAILGSCSVCGQPADGHGH